MTAPSAVILAFFLSSLAGALAYYRRWSMKRPPMGVMNLWDVAFTFVVILIIPFLYLWLPRPATVALLFIETTGLLAFLFEPVFARGSVALALAVSIASLDVGAAWRYGGASPVFMAVNNAVLVLVVIGVANLWVQSGLKARNMAILGLGLVAFDYVATWLTPTMAHMIERLSLQPFMPMFAWPLAPGAGGWVGWGLGDTLMAVGFPLVMIKGYGRRAGLMAAMLSVVAFVALTVALDTGILGIDVLPAMVVIGPLIALQYAYWRRRLGPERRIRDLESPVEARTFRDMPIEAVDPPPQPR